MSGLIVALLVLGGGGDTDTAPRYRDPTPPTELERLIIETAIADSPLTLEKHRDPWLLLEVLRLEEHPDIRVPREFRGMVLAASYRESVWSTKAIGDGGKSQGWLQIQKWHHRACSYFDRSDPVGNARCWLLRIRDTYERKTRQRCRAHARRGERNGWISAWRWVARGGKFPGCTVGEPRLHWSQLLCWQRGYSGGGYVRCRTKRARRW